MLKQPMLKQPHTTQPQTIKKQRSRDNALVREVVAERRRSSITARELDRAAAAAQRSQDERRRAVSTSVKYPRQDIVLLKDIFDAYDLDGSGTIEKDELVQALQKQKAQLQRVDGSAKTLEQRQAQRGKTVGQQARGAKAAKGAFLVDFADGLFRAMDANADEQVKFGELLRLMYPFATGAELESMLSWVSTEAPAMVLEEFELSDEQRREVRVMFELYDKDRNGTISRDEFCQAMRRCGLEEAETDEIFADADTDGSAGIDRREFSELMRKTLFSGEQLTPSMLYGPI